MGKNSRTPSEASRNTRRPQDATGPVPMTDTGGGTVPYDPNEAKIAANGEPAADNVSDVNVDELPAAETAEPVYTDEEMDEILSMSLEDYIHGYIGSPDMPPSERNGYMHCLQYYYTTLALGIVDGKVDTNSLTEQDIAGIKSVWLMKERGSVVNSLPYVPILDNDFNNQAMNDLTALIEQDRPDLVPFIRSNDTSLLVKASFPAFETPEDACEYLNDMYNMNMLGGGNTNITRELLRKLNDGDTVHDFVDELQEHNPFHASAGLVTMQHAEAGNYHSSIGNPMGHVGTWGYALPNGVRNLASTFEQIFGPGTAGTVMMPTILGGAASIAVSFFTGGKVNLGIWPALIMGGAGLMGSGANPISIVQNVTGMLGGIGDMLGLNG